MTEAAKDFSALYYRHPYQMEVKTRIHALVKEEGIVLEDALFYPEGGGQAGDQGRVLFPDGQEIEIADCQRRAGQILLIPADPQAISEVNIGEEVLAQVKEDRRRRFMQLHTAEHMISGYFARQYGANNVGFSMTEEKITIDLDLPIGAEVANEVERAVNQGIQANLRLQEACFEEGENVPYAYRSKREHPGALRLVTIPGFDVCACSGLHCERTGEIGLLHILSVERHRGGSRIEAIAGMKAVENLLAKEAREQWFRQKFSLPADRLHEGVERLEAQLTELKERLEKQSRRKIEALYRQWKASGKEAFCLIEADWETKEIQALLSRLTRDDGPGTSLLLHREEGGGYRFLLAPGQAELLARWRERGEVRGGGSAQLQQGRVMGNLPELVAESRAYLEERGERLWMKNEDQEG